jgi:predicted nucleic acid-binding protein
VKNKALVLDANILIRAVLGQRVRRILEKYTGTITFFVSGMAYAEADTHLLSLVLKRRGDPAKATLLLRARLALTEVVGPDLYGEFEDEARKRLGSRDPDDWPILATALALDCPIWTEDTDFFGCGVATWTSSRIEIFLSS